MMTVGPYQPLGWTDEAAAGRAKPPGAPTEHRRYVGLEECRRRADGSGSADTCGLWIWANENGVTDGSGEICAAVAEPNVKIGDEKSTKLLGEKLITR